MRWGGWVDEYLDYTAYYLAPPNRHIFNVYRVIFKVAKADQPGLYLFQLGLFYIYPLSGLSSGNSGGKGGKLDTTLWNYFGGRFIKLDHGSIVPYHICFGTALFLRQY